MSLSSQTNELKLRAANTTLVFQSNEVEKRAANNTLASQSVEKRTDDFTELLNKYVKYKSKYDKHYKTLNAEQIKQFKDEFKKQEEALSRSYNLLKTKKNKYYIDNYIVELCKKEIRMKLTNKNLGKILFKYFSDLLKDKSKEEVNKYVYDIINFIAKERISNEVLIIKSSKKREVDCSVEA